MQLENIKTFCDKLANDTARGVASQAGVGGGGGGNVDVGTTTPTTQEGMISCANIFPAHTISICRVQLWRSSYSSWQALAPALATATAKATAPAELHSAAPASSLTPSRASAVAVAVAVAVDDAVDVSYTNVNVGGANVKKYVG